MTLPSDSRQPQTFTKLYCDVRSARPESLAFSHGQIAFFSSPSPDFLANTEVRVNEDSAAIVCLEDGTGILAVADGMGGHAAGAQASSLAVQSLIECVTSASGQSSLLRTGIITGFEQANERVQKLGTGAGTTLAVAEIGQDYVRPYHCGDSIVLVTGGRGKLKLLTTCHSPVGFGVEAGLLDADEAMHHAERHLVLNAVGTAGMRIEIGPALPFRTRDTLLLASDGLTDNLSVPEMVECIRKGRLEKSLQALVQACLDRMQGIEGKPSKPDDLTVLAYRKSRIASLNTPVNNT